MCIAWIWTNQNQFLNIYFIGFVFCSARAGAKEEADECGQLYDAVFDNDFEKVKEILCWEDKSQEKIEYRKWYVNEKSWHKWRPLHAAAQAGYTDMAKFLVECGAEIDALTNVNNTALQLGMFLFSIKDHY